MDPEALLITDSKGLHDTLASDLPGDDKASAVEVPIIRETLQRLRGRARWLPHNENPSDGLTKFRGAHLEPLWGLVKSGRFHLSPEQQELGVRAAQPATLGHTLRSKVGVAGADARLPERL